MFSRAFTGRESARYSLSRVLRSSFCEFPFLHAKRVSKQALIAIVSNCLFEVTTIPLAPFFKIPSNHTILKHTDSTIYKDVLRK